MAMQTTLKSLFLLVCCTLDTICVLRYVAVGLIHAYRMLELRAHISLMAAENNV
jgi:hypothetical protein